MAGTTPALWAKGTKLLRKNDLGTYEPIPYLTNLTAPGITTVYERVTNHDSPGRFHEELATFLENEELTFEMVYVPYHSMHKAIHNDQDNGTERDWKVQFIDAMHTEFQFRATIARFSPTANYDGAYRATGALRITGAITRVPA